MILNSELKATSISFILISCASRVSSTEIHEVSAAHTHTHKHILPLNTSSIFFFIFFLLLAVAGQAEVTAAQMSLRWM